MYACNTPRNNISNLIKLFYCLCEHNTRSNICSIRRFYIQCVRTTFNNFVVLYLHPPVNNVHTIIILNMSNI